MDMLVDPATLEAMLGDADLRVFDATIHLVPQDAGRNGRQEWQAGHIPGSNFVDVQGQLSDQDSAMAFTRLPHDRLAAAFGQLGISDDSRVVAYTATPQSTMWATRLWWLLRSAGLQHAAVLDGGLTRWLAERRPISTEPCTYPPAQFDGEADQSWWATQQEVRSSVALSGVCTLNALPHRLHTGEVEMGYSRPGRIAHSQNLPFTRLVDSSAGTLLPEGALREQFSESGALEQDRVISYCGGGIAATLNGFALRLLRYENVGVYDGSLDEWSRDPSNPMETG